MADIIKEILKQLPENKISDACFEGANIVLYTKDVDFFLDDQGAVKKVVDDIKKRIELRPDPSIAMVQEKAEEKLREMIPEEAVLGSIIFDPQRSIVIIEAEKPGVVIGKQGSILRDIKKEIRWVPIVRRTPPIKSDIIENIRAVLWQNSDYRRKFLDKVGHRIYDGWIRGKKEEWVRLTALGAGRQVGRSCFFLQTPESRILLDCGINVASEEGAYPHLEVPELDINELDAVILTHSHVDHCGFIPYLYKFGYRGPVYTTAPTRDVAALILLDFIKIARADGKEPIFDIDDVREMVKHTITLEFGEVTDITPDVRLTLYNAGHILGSAMAHLHIGNGLHNFVYTGDLKFGRTILLDPANTEFPRVESLMMEATYGGKDNVLPPRKESDDALKKVIVDTVARGGKILMPTLGIGRSQEVLILLDRMIKAGEIEAIPIYIDGMVWDITAIHTAYPEYLNSSIRKDIFHKDKNPFLSENFKRVGSQKERVALVEKEGPCLIVATSGMLNGGPSVEYLKLLGEDPRNTLVFSCYQGEGTLGRRIMNGEREIMFTVNNKPQPLNLKMEVFRFEITSHSDRKELMGFAYKCNPRPRKIIVQHGENARCLDLASSIHRGLNIETVAPRNLETVRLR